ncbi:hypothetical protein ScPMuIL_013351 [Solemya velum]
MRDTCFIPVDEWQARTRRLLERLKDGGEVVVAEGYGFEFERRGRLKAGPFVPEIVLERPDLVRGLHEEFVDAGSDVVLAFTYYAGREHMKGIGKESLLENININALKIAREVADATGTLMAGDICNTLVYEKNNQEAIERTKLMFKEQVEWAADNGADYIVAETFCELGEALLALKAIKTYGKGLPAVVTITPKTNDLTFDGVPYHEVGRKLEEAGADVVGFNCGQGPGTIIPLIRRIKQAVKCPIAALPVVYRTTPEQPNFLTLIDPVTGKRSFPLHLSAVACSRDEIYEFARSAKELGVQYIGLCCGNASHYMRVVSEVYGRKPPSSKYSPDMEHMYCLPDQSEFYKTHAEKMKKYT